MTEKSDTKTESRNKKKIIELTYYTDPLCCWSWVLEPHLQRLKSELGNDIRWRYCMGGLIRSWSDYNDPFNSVYKPSQMGPLWMYASSISGRPMKSRIWVDNPPASSYPACIAVKCAGLQSAAAEENYLFMLRKAVMIEGQNISQRKVLVQIAETLSDILPGILNAKTFIRDLEKKKGEEAFHNDLKEVKDRSITRFPSFVVKKSKQNDKLLVGCRPYSELYQMLKTA